jgi:hypothetical protein
MNYAEMLACLEQSGAGAKAVDGKEAKQEVVQDSTKKPRSANEKLCQQKCQ